MKNKFTITESEKNRILGLYNLENSLGINEADATTPVDFSSPEAMKYYQYRIKQYMVYPEKAPSVGNTTTDVNVAAESFAKAISGMGRKSDEVGYIISKVFTSLPNIFEFFKAYKAKNEETFKDAIESQWFSGGIMENVLSRGSNAFREFCKSNPKNNLCIIKSEMELKTGI
jgi:hypothetical protein